MNLQQEVLAVLDEVLSLGGRALLYDRETPLLGSVAELDSMAVVTLLTTLEDRFGIAVSDDEVDGSTFETAGSLIDFVAARVG